MNCYFAPLESITSYPLRNTHAHFFPETDKYFSPFISCSTAYGENPQAYAGGFQISAKFGISGSESEFRLSERNGCRKRKRSRNASESGTFRRIFQ